MTSQMTGADADALDLTAGEVSAAARRLTASQAATSRALGSAPWFGRSADAFRDRWFREHVAVIRRATEHLEAAATSLRRNAEEQRAASAAGGPTNGSGGSPLVCTVEPGGNLEDQIADTRRSMENELDELRRQRAEMDEGLLGWFKDTVPGGGPTREDLDRRIDRLERLLKTPPDRKFLKVDVGGDGRIIEVLGDLDGADNIAIHIPGVSNDINNYLDRAHGDAHELKRAMDESTKAGTNNVVIAFLDYDSPDNAVMGGASGDAARDGARQLDSLVDSLRSNGFRADQITPVAHSYGSTLTGYALSEEHLDVARIAVVGSPGLGGGVDDISDLGRSDVDVYAGRAQGVEVFGHGDAVALAPFHGEDPTDEGFGARHFSTGEARGHSEYFQGKSLRNLGLIATGQSPE